MYDCCNVRLGNDLKCCSDLIAVILQRYIVPSLLADENACTISHWDITRWITSTKLGSSIVRCPFVSSLVYGLNYAMKALLMEKEPTNMQAQSLAALIDKRVTRGAHVYLP